MSSRTTNASPALATALATSLALIDQFLKSLDVTHPTATTSSIDSETEQEVSTHPSPLNLLTASSKSLKSTTTKLSLLTINTPFTPSAIVSLLQPLNSDILPSLVTATLLITNSPNLYPQSFVRECATLSKSTLRDLQSLIRAIKSRSEDGRPKSEMGEMDKKQVTEITGKVWEDCDLLVRFALEDVPGFVVRKAKQWLDLMKDAVKELEEWDPEEEDIDEEDFFGLGDDGDDDDDEHDDDEDEHDQTKSKQAKKPVDTNRVTISVGIKDQALKVLSRIPQSVHVVVKQRLEKFPRSSSTQQSAATSSASSNGEPMQIMHTAHRRTLDFVLNRTRMISDCIDESAEAMYLGDPELCLKKAGEARALTIDLVRAVVTPWTAATAATTKTPSSEEGSSQTVVETKEDQYINKALVWIQQVNTTTNDEKRQPQLKS